MSVSACSLLLAPSSWASSGLVEAPWAASSPGFSALEVGSGVPARLAVSASSSSSTKAASNTAGSGFTALSLFDASWLGFLTLRLAGELVLFVLDTDRGRGLEPEGEAVLDLWSERAF
ncbi:hypothetical protein GGR56DRAFT_482297 [Xylariaceae sp. FL0804]|nr:hypothetical protein GGR56DRAFT_482297 [Xylariaceae sp. FL0804]